MRLSHLLFAVAAGMAVLTLGVRVSLSGAFESEAVTETQVRASATPRPLPSGKSDSVRVNALLREADEAMKRDLRRAYALATEALALADRISFQRGMARAHAAAGRALLPQGGMDTVRNHFELALKFAEERRDGVTIASALLGLGMVDLQTSNTRQGLKTLHEARELSSKLDDRVGEGRAWLFLGRWFNQHSREEEARHCADSALRCFVESGNAPGIIAARVQQGRAAYGLGKTIQADSLYSQAARAADSIGDHRMRAQIRVLEGEIAGQYGKRLKALENFQDGLQRARACGDNSIAAHALRDIAVNHARRGMPVKARSCYEEALSLHHRLGERDRSAFILMRIGSTYAQEGRPDITAGYFQRSLNLARELRDSSNIATALMALGMNQQRRQNVDSARVYLNEALSVAHRSNQLITECTILMRLGALEEWIGEPGTALEHYLAAEALMRGERYAYQHAWCLAHIGSVHRAMQNWNQARKYCLAALELLDERVVPATVLNVRNDLGVATVHIASETMDTTLFREALHIFQDNRADGRSMTDPWSIAVAEHNIGVCLTNLSRKNESLGNFRRALAMYLEQGGLDNPDAARVCGMIGQTLYELHGLDRARDTLDLAVEWSESLNDRSGLYYHFRDMSAAFAEGGDYPEALAYHRRAVALQDSLLSEENRETVAALSAKYEAEQRERDIAEQKEELALKDLALARQQEELSRQEYQARERAQHIALLEKDREIRRLELSRTNAELERQRSASARRKQQAELLTTRNRLQASLLDREQTNRNALIGGLVFLLLIAGIIIRRARERRRTAERMRNTLTELRRTQDQLIHTEKMATLGEMTAGIAHEIRNPMNFISNFAEVTHELAEEALTAKDAAELSAVLDQLDEATAKIAEHSRRAEDIVSGMLMHARNRPGVREMTAINDIVEDYVDLAWNGYRARHPGTAVTLTVDTDPHAGKLEIVPQEIARVIINVAQNALQAVEARQRDATDDYAPSVRIATRRSADGVEIRIRDNGIGIPEELRNKIYQPFFTTKTTGEGTGLGLSMAYDIVVKGHNGSIDFDSAPGEGTTFVIRLPKSDTSISDLRRKPS